MKKTLSILTTLCLVGTAAAKQNTDKPVAPPTDPKMEIHYKDVAPIENDVYKIAFSDMHSQATFTLVHLEVTNKTDGYLVFDMNKIGFTYEGKGTYYDKGGVFNKANMKLIEPHQTKDFIVKATDDGGWMQVDKFHFTIDGISIYPVDGMTITPPEFQLPASRNSLDAGAVSVNLLKVKQATDATAAQFEMTYKGQSAMLVDYSKLSIRTQSGQVYANVYKKSKPEFAFPNTSTKGFVQVSIPANVVDMQFATLFVQFNDAIKELQSEGLQKIELNFEVDAVKTAEKAK